MLSVTCSSPSHIKKCPSKTCTTLGEGIWQVSHVQFSHCHKGDDMPIIPQGTIVSC